MNAANRAGWARYPGSPGVKRPKKQGKSMKPKKNNRPSDSDQATREAAVKTTTQANASAIDERIRQRAYEIHLARGGTPGQDFDDWLQAEREIKAEIQKAPDASDEA